VQQSDGARSLKECQGELPVYFSKFVFGNPTDSFVICEEEHQLPAYGKILGARHVLFPGMIMPFLRSRYFQLRGPRAKSGDAPVARELARVSTSGPWGGGFHWLLRQLPETFLSPAHLKQLT